jgi:Aspartyl/Asparaginyl beta-hydroxylase/Tetratricopeptide repeat
MDAATLERDADAAAARRDFAEARDLLTKATQANQTRFELWLKLSAVSRATGDPAGALKAIDRALAIQPLDFSALLMRATQLEALGRADQAGEAFGRALAQAPENPPVAMSAVIDKARAAFRAWQDRQANALRDAVAVLTPALEHMITNAVRLTEPDRAGPTHYCYPDLAEIPFHGRAKFPWLASLDAATDMIAAEFAAIAANEAAELVPYIQYPDNVPLDQWRALNNNRDWTAIHLIDRGRTVQVNARHCPKTMALLQTLPQPNIPGAGPNAMFSLLAPNTHIPPHTGIANTRLVCHLPLIVPEGCWFRVGEDRRDWRRGQAWVFDDTIVHEAMNPSDRLRVILIVDVWHPDLDDIARSGVAAIISHGGGVHGL